MKSSEMAPKPTRVLSPFDIAERERASIAQEIHDTLGAETTSLRLMLQRLETSLGTSGLKLPDDIGEQMLAMRVLVDSLYTTARSITTKLRPDVLDVIGLHAALISLVKESETRNRGCTYSFHSTGDIVLTAVEQIAAYRIVQEALMNVFKHSRASQCYVSAEMSRGRTTITVIDNGVAKPDDPVAKDGYGLSTMEARASAVAAKLGYGPSPLAGYSVSVTFENDATATQ